VALETGKAFSRTRRIGAGKVDEQYQAQFGASHDEPFSSTRIAAEKA
jgi:hypothetical protein